MTIEDPDELEQWAYKLTDRLAREGVLDTQERRQLVNHLDNAFGEYDESDEAQSDTEE